MINASRFKIWGEQLDRTAPLELLARCLQVVNFLRFCKEALSACAFDCISPVLCHILHSASILAPSLTLPLNCSAADLLSLSLRCQFLLLYFMERCKGLRLRGGKSSKNSAVTMKTTQLQVEHQNTCVFLMRDSFKYVRRAVLELSSTFCPCAQHAFAVKISPCKTFYCWKFTAQADHWPVWVFKLSCACTTPHKETSKNDSFNSLGT